MISSKILVQSAAAGLMAGAILAMPMFVFGPEDASFDQTRCPYKSSMRKPSMYNSSMHSSKRANDHRADIGAPTARFEPPTLRAAPSQRRSLEERNRAAKQALQQIEKAYKHSEVHSQAVQTAHSITLHTMARHAATRVNFNSNMLINCKGQHRKMCLNLLR